MGTAGLGTEDGGQEGEQHANNKPLQANTTLENNTVRHGKRSLVRIVNHLLNACYPADQQFWLNDNERNTGLAFIAGKWNQVSVNLLTLEPADTPQQAALI